MNHQPPISIPMSRSHRRASLSISMSISFQRHGRDGSDDSSASSSSVPSGIVVFSRLHHPGHPPCADLTRHPDPSSASVHSLHSNMHHSVAADPEIRVAHVVHLARFSPPPRPTHDAAAAAFAPRPTTADRSRPLTLYDSASATAHPSRPRANTTRPSMVSNLVTPDEYDALPPSIQKKYFSSVERLRIAQESAAQKRRKQRPSMDHRLSSLPSLDSVRPSTSHSSKPSDVTIRPRTAHSFKSLTQHRKSSSRPVRTEADVDEEQALRFLSLPDKVKRSHFTNEELVLLTESSERALGSPFVLNEDGVSRYCSLDRNGSYASSSQRPSSTSDDDMPELDKDWREMETGSNDSFGPPDFDPMRKNDAIRSGSVSTYSSLSTSTVVRELGAPGESRRKSSSRRRRFSLAPLPLPPPTLSSAMPPLPPPHALSNFGAITTSPKPTPMPSDTPATTKYYKDTQARQKLRDYLSSPEKFDEALEFGFPGERADQFPPRSTSIPSITNAGLDSGTDSQSTVNSGDDDDQYDHDESPPKTPSSSQGDFHASTTPHSSVDSGVVLPLAPVKASARSLSPDINGREMTLRMTLTRPDLRAPEQELYSFQRKEVSGVEVANSDPLALEALPVCDDHTGAHGAFAVSRSSTKVGVKKLWNNLRGR